VEILGDDEDDGSVVDRSPVEPRATAWDPGTPAFRPGEPDDRSVTARDPQSGRGDGAQRLRSVRGAAEPALDLGEQARDPAWERVWNTDPIPLSTVRVEPDDAPGDAGPDAGTAPARDTGTPADTAPSAPIAPATPADATGPVGLRALLLGTIASAEALALTGVIVAIGTSVNSLTSMLAFLSPTSTPRDQLDAFAMAYALGGILAAALGVAACLRLRPHSNQVVRGLAGAAVLLGVLLLVLAAFTTIQAGNIPLPDQGVT
jgi:hypothetical protein